MANTLLACPHCGSALTFGMEIKPGTPVECLICMQSFPAQPTLPSAENSKAGKSATPPIATAVSANSKSSPPTIPTATKAKSAANPRPAAQASAAAPSSKASLILALVGVFLLLALGTSFGAWMLANPAAPTLAESNPPPIGDDVKEKPPVPENVAKLPITSKGNPPAITDDDDDDLRRKKEAEKKLLVRKDPVKPAGNDLEFNPISTIKMPTINVPGLEQAKINKSIEKGVAYLKKSQNENGTWYSGHDLGSAAIGGLTLLECGVPVDDASIARVAKYVRTHSPQHSTTYELSLSLLFLDRLADPRDRLLIQWLSLRLLAGQDESGGWSYNCPLHRSDEMVKFHNFLQSRRTAMKNPVDDADLKILVDPLPRDPMGQSELYEEFRRQLFARLGVGDPTVPKGKGKMGDPRNPVFLSPEIRALPVVRNQGKKKGELAIQGGGADNSNTQFALLAIWAARRHGIPTDAALVFAHQRFQVTQTADGGWGYQDPSGGSSDTMTCVGLLGVAMGHVVAVEAASANPKEPKAGKPILEDLLVKKGLSRLTRVIGQPSPNAKKVDFPMKNLYLLWSIERVAMLYDLNTINGKDWYGWGAQMLVHNQLPEGDWNNGQYHGEIPSVNTCFALLFLKRSNLVQDLTNHLRLHSAIRDPG